MANPYHALVDDEPQTPANPYDELIDRQDEQQRRTLGETLRAAEPVSPDARAEALTLADQYRMPIDVVERNLDHYRQRAARDRPELEQVITRSPKLAEWLTAQPHVAAAVKDDLEQLGALEWLITAPTRAYRRGNAQVEFGALRAASLFRTLTLAEETRLGELRIAMSEGGELGAGQSWMRGAVTGTAQQLPMWFGAALEGARLATPAAITAGSAVALLGQAGPQVAVPEEILTVPAAAILAGRSGMLAGAAKFGFEQEAGLAYDEYLGFKDELGRPIDPQIARVAAIATGMLNAGLEAYGFETLMQSIPGARMLSGKALRGAVKEALRNPTVRGALARAAGGYATTLAKETGTEVGQRGVTILLGEIAKGAQNASARPAEVTTLAPAAEAEFRSWVAANRTAPGVAGFDGPDARYDMRGFWADKPALATWAPGDHFPDTYKQHGHPTFSVQSKYSAGPTDGGTWAGEVFTAPDGRQINMADPAAAEAFNREATPATGAGIPYRSGGDIAADLLNEGASALQSFALLVLPGHAAGGAIDAHNARQAQHNRTFFTALGEGVAHSKTAQRLPAAAEAFVARATKDGPIETLFAPVDTWTTYWQSKGVDPAAMATELTGDASAYERARNTGEDLAIPTSVYAITLAATEHNTFFQSELRLGADQMNARESDAFVKAEAAKRAAPASTSAAAPVKRAIAAKLEATGETPAAAEALATLWASAIGQMADDAGVDPVQRFDRYGLEIAREGLPSSIDPNASNAAGIPPSIAAPNETPQQRMVRTRAHTEALASSVVRDARAVDPNVDPEIIRAQLEMRMALHEDGLQATHDAGRGLDLVRAVAAAGGLAPESAGGLTGELRLLRENQGPGGSLLGVAGVFRNTRELDENGKVNKGHGFDVMVQRLQQDPRFSWIESTDDLIEGLHEATRGTSADALPGTAELAELGVKPGTKWWTEAGVSDSQEPEDGGDASFDTELFQVQSLDDILAQFGDVPDARLVDERGTETNASGESGASLEAQRRLAGMRARGQHFAVRDRRGLVRALVGVDAVDYQPRAGETFGIQSAAGFAVLSVGDAQRVRTFYQDKLGSTTFGPDRNNFRINLFARANRSTFIHESAHFFFEFIADLAEDIQATDSGTYTEGQLRLLDNYGSLLRYVGVESRDQVKTEQHEKVALAFEAYLFEGQAPSVELRSVFAQFRTWLVGVYRSIRALNVELNPDIRRVFDRMLASDDAIAAAREEAHVTALFTDAASAGMSPLEFASYQDLVRRESAKAREALQDRVARDLARERETWWGEEEAALRVDITSEFNEQPVYRALSVMRTGAYPDGTPLHEGQAPAPIKLSRDSLVAQFGHEILRRLPRPYVYAAAGGISADTAAELFGFSSGDALIQALIETRPMRQVVDEQVQARMVAKYGDVVRGGALKAEARRVVEGEHRATIVQAELRALTKGMLGTTIPSAETINAAAAQRIAATRIRDLRPGTFLQASRRASRLAFELMASGEDRAGAVRAKLQELINLALYRAARDAQEHVESMRRTLQGYGSTVARQRFGKAGAAYLEQIDGLLARYELTRTTLTDLERRSSLRAFVDEQTAEGMPVDIPTALIDDSRTVNYLNVTLEEFTGVYEAVEHIAHLARLKNALLAAAKKRSFDDAKATLVGSILLHNEVVARPLEFRPAGEKWRTISDWYASHSKISQLARALDGHEDGGEMWEQIIRPLNAAADAEQTRKSAAAVALAQLITDAYPGRELRSLNTKLFIPAIGDSLSKEGRLAVALNSGNEGNRARLVSDPTRTWNEAQVQAILDTLDARDWRFVQGVWDHIDSYWEEIAAKQQRVTGLRPEKVAAAEVVNQHGVFRGGYYPIAYDGRLVARAAVFQSAGTAELMTMASYVRSTTARGHVEARKENVKLSMRLELGVAFDHVEQVLHDLTHHEVLIDVNRILRDDDVQRAVFDTKGDQVYQQFKSALQDIAIGAAPATGILERAANFARTGTQLAMMGFNLWTGLQQPLGLSIGMDRIGSKWVARGTKRWLRDAASMENTARWINEVSPLMRSRAVTATQDLADVRAALTRPGGWFDLLVRSVSADTVTQADILNSYLWHIGMMQRVADIPVWLGQFEKSMAGGEEEARAIALADQAVLESQGGGQIKDLAAVQRGGPIAKLFMMFYSYGNVVFNRTADAVGRTNFRRVGSVGDFLSSLSLLYVASAVGTVALAHVTGRKGGDDDDWATYLREVGGETLSAALNTMVLVRELQGLVSEDGVRGYAGPAGMRVLQSVYAVGAQVRQGEVDVAALKAANALGGILFRYPAAQVQRSVDGFLALRDGRTKNPAALLFGAPPTRQGR